jgi:hypothetical protein
MCLSFGGCSVNMSTIPRCINSRQEPRNGDVLGLKGKSYVTEIGASMVVDHIVYYLVFGIGSSSGKERDY